MNSQDAAFEQLVHDLENITDDALRHSAIERANALRKLIQAEQDAHSAYRLEKDRQTQELLLLGTARTALSHQLDLQGVIHEIVEGIAETFGYTLVSIYLLEGSELVLQHQVGYDSVIERIPVSIGVSGQVVRTGKSILLKDVHIESDFLGAISGIVSEICVPLLDGTQVVGILNVESIAGQVLTERDLNLMIALSEHVSIAIQRARLYSELHENHQRYESVLETVGEIVYQTSVDGKLIFLNPAWSKITGFSVSESIGKLASDFNYPDDSAMALRNRQRLLENSEEYIHYEMRLVTKSGGFRWVDVKAHQYHDEQGNLIGTTGTLTDITEQKLAVERAADQRLFAETLREVAGSLISILDLGEILDQIVTYIARVVPYTALCVAIFDRNQLRPVRGYGYAERGVGNWQDAFALKGDIYAAYQIAARSGGFTILSQPYQQTEFGADNSLGWVKSRLYVPIRAYGETIGIICLDSDTNNAYTEGDANRVLAIADQSGMAIRNAELYSALSQRAADLQQRVTERTEELKRTHQQIEALLNASSDGIIVVDTSGVIIRGNPAFCFLLGRESQELIGKRLIEFTAPESREALNAALDDVFAHRQRRRIEIAAVDSSGVIMEVDIVLDPMAQPDLAVCSLRDITDRLQIEKGLRRALDHERKLVELKSQFGVTVSHEFRTPLAVIQSSTELLERYFAQLNEARRKELFDNVRNQIDYMTQVIDNILIVSKADTIGLPVDLQTINLLDFCTTIAHEMQWLAGEQHQIVFQHEGDLSVAQVDPYLMRRILVNLLSNAIKYSPGGGQVEFNLVRDHDQVHIEIRDQGIGIPPSDVENLFDTFQRAGNVGSIPGTGIGLAIVKRAVELHSGTIKVASTLAIGTTFHIELPMLTAGAAL